MYYIWSFPDQVVIADDHKVLLRLYRQKYKIRVANSIERNLKMILSKLVFKFVNQKPILVYVWYASAFDIWIHFSLPTFNFTNHMAFPPSVISSNSRTQLITRDGFNVVNKLITQEESIW